MNGLFAYDGKVAHFFGKMFDYIILSVIFLLTCVPVVTIGASITAFYGVILKSKENGYIRLSEYFKVWKNNFWKATLIWLITCALGAILYVDYVMCMQMTGIIKFIMLLIVSVVTLTLLLTIQWVFPLIAVDSTKPFLRVLYECLLRGIGYLPQSILSLLVTSVPFLVFLIRIDWFFIMIVFWALFWPGISMATNFHILKKGLPIIEKAIEENHTEE